MGEVTVTEVLDDVGESPLDEAAVACEEAPCLLELSQDGVAGPSRAPASAIQ